MLDKKAPVCVLEAFVEGFIGIVGIVTGVG